MDNRELQDVRRDAAELLRTDISLHILDVGMEDLPSDSDIKLLTDSGDDDEWVGIFTNDNNAERIYEVKYNVHNETFFITTYIMAFCKKYDPMHLY